MIKRSRTTARFDCLLKKLSKKHFDLGRLDLAIKTILAEDHEGLVHQFDWQSCGYQRDSSRQKRVASIPNHQ